MIFSQNALAVCGDTADQGLCFFRVTCDACPVCLVVAGGHDRFMVWPKGLFTRVSDALVHACRALGVTGPALPVRQNVPRGQDLRMLGPGESDHVRDDHTELGNLRARICIAFGNLVSLPHPPDQLAQEHSLVRGRTTCQLGMPDAGTLCGRTWPGPSSSPAELPVPAAVP